MEPTSYRLELGNASIDIPDCHWLADAIHQLQSLGVNHKPSRAFFLAADGQWVAVADMALRSIYRNQHY